jgi:UDP-hydrolysing UDP-N-acetyl-D-glucosamine 2-epimerase
MDIQELSRSTKAPLRPGYLLVTYHPETLSPRPPEDQIQQLLNALLDVDRQLVITGCNADAGGERIALRLHDLCRRRDGAYLFASAGQDVYINLMRHAAAMVGNSSSGIIEAPSIPLAVVNIGERQRGRLRAANVIDVPYNDRAITAGIQTATSDSFRRRLAGLKSPYGDGRTSEQIVQVLAAVQLGPELLQKTFHDLPAMEAVNP